MKSFSTVSATPLARIIDGAAPRQDCSARLLLLLSRAKLTKDQTAEARRLAESVSDWEELTQLAARKFVAAFAYRHLTAVAADLIPPVGLGLLRRLAYASTLTSLRVAAAQLAFHQSCIASTGASHAYLKGAALAVQNGQDVGGRPSRDIDVLVADKNFRSVLDRAVAAGYSIFIDASVSERATCNRDVDFLARHADVVTIIDPSGVPIELHRHMDKQSIGFNLDAALATSVTVKVFGVSLQTLSKPLHFNYICYHHSRHFWSKLHWVADLDAMASDPDFDRAEIGRLADEVGLTPTVEAALEFSALTSRPDLWDVALASKSRGAQFLTACIFNLDGDLELEQSLRRGMLFGDFISSWQIADRYDGFAHNSVWRRLRPTTTQYLRRRLPRSLHWLYFLRNGATLARKSLAEAAGLVGSKPSRITQKNKPERSS